jgi:hypothetical protein
VIAHLHTPVAALNVLVAAGDIDLQLTFWEVHPRVGAWADACDAFGVLITVTLADDSNPVRDTYHVDK